MTNKQYERLGRAVECVAKMNDISGNMDYLRMDLNRNLAALIGEDEAHEFTKRSYGCYGATVSVPYDFLNVVSAAFKEDAK